MKKYLFSLCFTLFLLLAFPVCAKEAEPLKGTAVVNVDKLNVRSGPSKEYEKLGTLTKEVTIEIKGIVEPDWYVIDFEGEDGYINSEYVIFTPEEEIESGSGAETQKYIVMALIVLILIISGVAVYTFINMQKEGEEDEEEKEELPVVSHDDTNMHLGEVTYDTYRIDIDPKYFEKTTIIPQPESIWNEEENQKKELFQEEAAAETDVVEQVKTKTEIKNLDSKLEQASAQIAALQKEVEELKKSQTGSII